MAISVDVFPKKKAVPYPSIRADLRSGDILLCSGSAWFSRMIQRATDSVWSHVGFVMWVQAIDRLMVLESVEPLGVRTVPVTKYLRDYDSKGNPYPGGLVVARHRDFEQKATPDRLRELGQFAVQLFGYPYDKNEIAKIAARIAASFLPFSDNERKELKPDNEYICSEYAWHCYAKFGVEIEYDPRGFVAPSGFARTKEVDLVAVLRQKT